jgi:hypothetical protein
VVRNPDPSTYRYLNYTINENGNLVQFANATADYKTDVESRLAVDLISRQATDPRPFFMWLTFSPRMRAAHAIPTIRPI